MVFNKLPFKKSFEQKKNKKKREEGGRRKERDFIYEVTGHCGIARVGVLFEVVVVGCVVLCCVGFMRVSFTWGGFLFLNWMADLTDANSATPLLPSLITFSLGYASSLQIQF